MAHCDGWFSVKNQPRDLLFSDCRGDQRLSTGPLFSTTGPKIAFSGLCKIVQTLQNRVQSVWLLIWQRRTIARPTFFTPMRSFGSRELTHTLKRVSGLLFREGYFRAKTILKTPKPVPFLWPSTPRCRTRLRFISEKCLDVFQKPSGVSLSSFVAMLLGWDVRIGWPYKPKLLILPAASNKNTTFYRPLIQTDRPKFQNFIINWH